MCVDESNLLQSLLQIIDQVIGVLQADTKKGERNLCRSLIIFKRPLRLYIIKSNYQEHLRRIKPSGNECFADCRNSVPWVIEIGCSINDSVPPRDTANVIIRAA